MVLFCSVSPPMVSLLVGRSTAVQGVPAGEHNNQLQQASTISKCSSRSLEAVPSDIAPPRVIVVAAAMLVLKGTDYSSRGRLPSVPLWSLSRSLLYHRRHMASALCLREAPLVLCLLVIFLKHAAGFVPQLSFSLFKSPVGASRSTRQHHHQLRMSASMETKKPKQVCITVHCPGHVVSGNVGSDATAVQLFWLRSY